MNRLFKLLLILFVLQISQQSHAQGDLRISDKGSLHTQGDLGLSDKGYLHTQGLDVTFFSDFYPDGHQSGVTIIMHGSRIAANGDLRLEPSPGQWSPTPTGDDVVIDKENQRMSKNLRFPNPVRDRKGFNPIIYPDLEFSYSMEVEPAGGNSFRVRVHLDEPLPMEYIGKVGFNLELFPGELFGKSWIMDDQTGYFAMQPSGLELAVSDTFHVSKPMATGRMLAISPDNPYTHMRIESKTTPLELRDGRTNHNNGWFIVRSTVPAGATKNAIEWIVTPNVVEGWKYTPVIQVSQLGYHPSQGKKAIIEMDNIETAIDEYALYRVGPDGEKFVTGGTPELWGDFLRYKYYVADFSEVQEPGVYKVRYGGLESHAFRIDENIYNDNTWQPTVEYYLPVQMCHMRVNEKYRVWHDVCHLDDALMAPTDHTHFDGYRQGPETMTDYEPGDAVPHLDAGGWHDAGDYDLRVESQAGTVRMLAWMVEEFGLELDATMIDQEQKLVEIHQPDGKSDVLQQIEHGLLTILGGYEALGRLYRGIICQDLRQYVMLGDAASMTDNLVYDATLSPGERTGTTSAVDDDRWVFTEENPDRELQVAAALTAASRVLGDYNAGMAERAHEVAEALYASASSEKVRTSSKVLALSELILTTESDAYIDELVSMEDQIVDQISRCGSYLGRVIHKIDDRKFKKNVAASVKRFQEDLEIAQAEDSPYGVPYEPNIWGAGWTIQRFGVDQYLFHKGWPEYVSSEYYENALNFILGVHPGVNNASFASGVGANSVTVAYGVNRADWSFIPGGVASGTALIRPDLPEMKIWPFFWQQTEYVMGGGATNFMFLTLAVHHLYND